MQVIVCRVAGHVGLEPQGVCHGSLGLEFLDLLERLVMCAIFQGADFYIWV